MNFKQKKVLVYGLGKSGLAAAKLLNQKEANVIFYDDNKEALKALKTVKELAFEYDTLFYLNEEVCKYLYAVVLNPAVSIYNKKLEIFKKNNIPIISELELGYLFKNGKVIAITGTNGKTTTVELINHIFKTANKRATKCGNIGIPFTSSVLDNKITNYIVEVSSFQLETIQKFKGNISCILNIASDHLNRHKSLKNYIKAKELIFKNSQKTDYAILNADDKVVYKLKNKLNCKVYFFSVEKTLKKGVFIKEKNIVFADNNKEKVIAKLKDISTLKNYNLSNLLCAILVSYLSKISASNILKGVNTFKALPNRVELVKTKNNIEFYNDSKATNISATLNAVKNFNKPIILMLGGSSKKQNYDELFCKLPKNVKFVTVSGTNALDILNSAKKYKFTFIKKCNSFLASCKEAYKQAKKGDVVLLSPASASFDEFKNYKHRGDTFKKWVNAL